VALGLVLVMLAGAGSYAWLAASAASRASSAVVLPPDASSPPTGAQTPPSTVASSVPTLAPGSAEEAVEALKSLVPAALARACTPVGLAAPGAVPASGGPAAVHCQQDGNTVLYAALPDLATTQRTFASVISGSGVSPGSGGCWDGSPGAVTYTYGQVACWTDPATGAGTIAWTYEPANVIASVSGDDTLRRLVSWWWFRALVQPPANAAGLTPDEEALVELLPEGLQATCRHYDPVKDPSGFDPVGSLGSVDCFPNVAHVADVGVFGFTTSDAMATWYDYRVARANIEADSGGCLDGTAGETAWKHGRILCFLTSGRKAAIRWTDDRYQLYGALNATDRDIASLVEWWRSEKLP
jgi:hypothetical protein